MHLFRILDDKNNDEVNTRAKTQTSATKYEGGMQTRQLKEAGVSTTSNRIITRGDKTRDGIDAMCGQTNHFKPANQAEAVTNSENEGKQNKNQESSNGEYNMGTKGKPGLTKSRSFGTSSWQLRARNSKYSNKDAPETIGASKSVEESNNLPADEDMGINNGTNSSFSLTASTGEEPASKRKMETRENHKPSRNLTYSKNKDECSRNGSSEKSDIDSKEQLKGKKKDKQKEKVCLNWIKSLNKLEEQTNMASIHKFSEDNAPEFCCNKSCPISENKIAKTPKVLKLAKKVTLRKACFGNNDERWYWLMCLKAHNDSLYCYYCGQIYFMEEYDLEDDGKAWIQCDDCNKWVSVLRI